MLSMARLGAALHGIPHKPRKETQFLQSSQPPRPSVRPPSPSHLYPGGGHKVWQTSSWAALGAMQAPPQRLISFPVARS